MCRWWYCLKLAQEQFWLLPGILKADYQNFSRASTKHPTIFESGPQNRPIPISAKNVRRTPKDVFSQFWKSPFTGLEDFRITWWVISPTPVMCQKDELLWDEGATTPIIRFTWYQFMHITGMLLICSERFRNSKGLLSPASSRIQSSCGYRSLKDALTADCEHVSFMNERTTASKNAEICEILIAHVRVFGIWLRGIA